MAMGAPHTNMDADADITTTTTIHTRTNTHITASPTPTTITHHYPKTSLGALHPLPPELIQHILFLLTAHTPLGPPTQLAPVRLASRALHAHATSAALLARVCRFKFDVGAVRRRCFEPGLEDLKAQLELGCRVLRGVRRGLVRLLEEETAAASGGGGGVRGGGGMAGRVEDRGYDDWEDWDGDMTDEDTLFGALLLMLDNDGKNYAQLEHAGVHAYVERFVLRRLWARARENAGWPVEDASSACALWVMWLTTDRARLVAESPRDRENIVLSILPFVFLTHRYPASEAPPNHFHLPLRDTAHAASGPLPWAPRTAFYPPRERVRGSAYDDNDANANADDGEAIPDGTSNNHHHHHEPQHYPHYLPTRAFLTPYFRALPELTPPLASTAAKLLFVSRREVRPFGIPQHLPRDREDAVRRWWVAQVETVRAMTAQVHLQGIANAAAAAASTTMNANPTATATVGLTLDEIQQAMHLPIPPMPAHVTPPINLGPTQADYRALNRGKAAPLPRGARWDWEVGRARGVNEDPEADVDDDDGGGVDGGMSRTMRSRAQGGVDEEESRKWDTLWWRMRLCGDFRAPQPRFAPGAVFERGCMRGMWLGKIYIPQGHLQVHLIRHNPPYPGLPDARGLFSEASLGMVMQPVFMDMEEHVKVCGCASSVSARRAVGEDQGHGHGHGHAHGQCGVIPVPPPSGIADWRGVPFAGVLPADLPAGHPQHGPPPVIPPVVAPVGVVQPPNANANIHANANALNANANVNANNAQNANVQNANAHAQNPNANANQNPNDANDDPNDPTEPNPTATGGGAALDSSREHTERPRPLDYSMSNAWLPGGIGDLMFAKRSVGGGGAGIPLVVRGKGGRLDVVDVVNEGEEGLRRRDELVVSTTGREPDLLRARGCGAFELHASSASSLSSTISTNTSSSSPSSPSSPSTPTLTSSSTSTTNSTTTSSTPPHLPDAVPEECYVYETYDPAKISLHDILPEAYSYAGPSRSWVTGGDAARGVGVVGSRCGEGVEGSGCDDEIATHEIVNPHCARCVEREEERRKERAREGRRAVRALERRAAAASASASAAAGATGAAKREIGAEARGVGERAAKRRRVGESALGEAAAVVSSSEAVSSDATSPMSTTNSTTNSTPTTSTPTTPTPTAATTASARAAEAQRQLEALMRVYRRPGASSGGEGSSFGDDVDVDVDMDASVEELDVTGFGLRMEDEDVDMDVEEGRDLDLDEGEEEYDEEGFSSEEDESSEEEDDDDENDPGRQIDVLGDDIPHGHPGIWTASPSSPLPKRKYIPRTRREYARARITSIPSPCTHAADTLFTGHTPACGLAWGQRYTTYGRLRPWDGLVGLVRVGRNPVNFIFIFIFGYVVGGGTFVGEWRVAASDPMRPAWGGAFVMSRVGG
ncbi:hypothetical protein BDN70DRAFT_932997 [Pholiota conissans]|uniref:F-box domain-containing protein n=1 Tax=Pholiota conissans TaxID=109636 RepID=A0A9P6CT29_9AGAR|nr:hypothetical protein BDN70DRAFT_932997 [Pholiota conissans]